MEKLTKTLERNILLGITFVECTLSAVIEAMANKVFFLRGKKKSEDHRQAEIKNVSRSGRLPTAEHEFMLGNT